MGKLCVSCMHKNDPYELKTESQVTNYAAINLAEGF